MDIFYIATIIILIVLVIYLLLNMKKTYKKGANDMFDVFLKNGWQHRVDWFKTMNKFTHKNPVVFVGDSLTNEYLLTEMLPGKPVCNRGIGGDTTLGVLKRMNESIFDLDPKELFLTIGTNDIELTDQTNKEIVKNIESILTKTQEYNKEIKINLVSIPPVCETKHPHVDPNTVGKRTNIRIIALNDELKVLAKKLNVKYVDLFSFLADENNSLKPEYTREGLHFSHLAYEKITQKLKDLI